MVFRGLEVQKNVCQKSDISGKILSRRRVTEEMSQRGQISEIDKIFVQGPRVGCHATGCGEGMSRDGDKTTII
jgi:hypothetical protein